jgi:riboflavin synthase
VFGGLIAHRGRVSAVERDPRGGLRLLVEAPEALAEGVEAKDSIAIDGVCLTVVSHDGKVVAFDVVPETLSRSTLGELYAGARVNLELSLRLGDRIGGHLVYGHIDATTTVLAKASEGQGQRLTFDLPDALAPYLIEKGYVALDGVSLTIAAARGGRFEVALIPETAERTGLGRKQPGERVNLEIDPVARYAVGSAELFGHRGGDASSDELDWAYEI